MGLTTRAARVVVLAGKKFFFLPEKIPGPGFSSLETNGPGGGAAGKRRAETGSGTTKNMKKENKMEKNLNPESNVRLVEQPAIPWAGRVLLWSLALALAGAVAAKFTAHPPAPAEASLPAGEAPSPAPAPTAGPSGEQLRTETLRELNQLRAAAAKDLAAVGAAHETRARQSLHGKLVGVFQAARERIPAYADYLVSLEAEGRVAKAVWNKRLAEELTAMGEEYLLSHQTLEAALEEDLAARQRDLAGQVEKICADYDYRMVQLLSRLDQPTPARVPDLSLGSLQTAAFGNPILRAQVQQVNAMVLGGLAGGLASDYASRQFIPWLLKRLGIKSLSKPVRIGSGLASLGVGLAVGVALEKAADRWLIKPDLRKQLEAQLGSIERRLLQHQNLPGQLAASQAAIVAGMASELNKPLPKGTL